MMRAAAILAALALATPATADSLTEAEMQVVPRILSAVAVEISESHIGQETAILLRSADADAETADLVILAGVPDDAAGQPIGVTRGLAYAGTLAGQVPSLQVSPTGSLLVQSEQTGIGSSPWQQTLTLAERGDRIVAAGFTMTQWDRNSGGSAVCDWNLLTGKWTLDVTIPQDKGPDKVAKHGGQQASTLTLADWGSAQTPDLCVANLGD